MSDFRPHAVRIGKVGKHPQADTLSITMVYGHPVIFRTGEILQGDLCLYVPPDALVDTNLPEFSWLKDKSGVNESGIYRVRASKIRNVPSYGFILPLTGTTLSDAPEGTDLRHHFGITKYDPGPAYNLNGEISGDYYTNSLNEMIPHYDIENLRRYTDLFRPKEVVYVTEKIHGTNARFIHSNGELHCGSRTKFRKNSVWNKIAEKYRLEGILDVEQGLCLYGEIFGPGIQDLTYGVKEPDVRFFDIYDTKEGRWWNTEDFRDFCYDYHLPTVPVIYCGPYDGVDMFQIAEGDSTLARLNGVTQVREGIVVKPAVERWDQEVGRVSLKLPGEGYLLRNKTEGQKLAEKFVWTPMDQSPQFGPDITFQPQESNVAPVAWWTRVVTFLSNLFIGETP